MELFVYIAFDDYGYEGMHVIDVFKNLDDAKMRCEAEGFFGFDLLWTRERMLDLPVKYANEFNQIGEWVHTDEEALWSVGNRYYVIERWSVVQ